MNRRLRLALALAMAAQWPLIAGAVYRMSYDAHVHMFFADHYRRNWWSLWEPRWYGGFSVASYPPLAHQLIALLAFPLGIELAWAVVLWLVLASMPGGVYAFSRIFVGSRAAGYAAIASAVLPSVYLAAHTFGQLPTLAGLLAALWGLAALNAYLHRGRLIDFVLAVALMAVVAATHHATLLFVPFGVLAVGAQAALTGGHTWRRYLLRLALFSLAALAAIVAVIWPFWEWGLGQAMQTPIDHPTRHNLLSDVSAQGLFFWAIYGPLVLIVPWAVRMSLRRKRLALGMLFAVMFTLGLGGTTPLPGWLFGSGWAWLTYDRFALWASVALVPFVGLAAIAAQRALQRLASHAWPVAHGAALMVLAIAAFISALLATLVPMQPASLDMQPIVAFLSEGDRAQWRYLTFGFGDQLARLSMLTEATTIDGSYHTARELPELRASGIGQIDTAYWLPGGLQALDPILARARERGVRWGFVNRRIYGRVLARHGWVRLITLPNGVDVWENPDAPRPPPDVRAVRENGLDGVWWGTLPLAALATTVGLAAVRQHLVRSGFGRISVAPKQKSAASLAAPHRSSQYPR